MSHFVLLLAGLAERRVHRFRVGGGYLLLIVPARWDLGWKADVD